MTKHVISFTFDDETKDVFMTQEQAASVQRLVDAELLYFGDLVTDGFWGELGLTIDTEDGYVIATTESVTGGK